MAGSGLSTSLDVEYFDQGTRDLQRIIKQYGEKGADAFAAAAYMWSTNVISLAMRNTPVFTGFLRQSRYVELPFITGVGGFSIKMGFSAPYAAAVHEIRKNYVVGDWKYLERALDRLASGAMSQIAMWTARFIKEGKGIAGVGVQHPTEPLQGPVHRPYAPRPGETKKQRKARIKSKAKMEAKRRNIPRR